MIPSAGGAPTPVTELAQGESHASLAANSARRQGGAIHLQRDHVGFDGANIEVMSLADQGKTAAGKRCNAEALLADTCRVRTGMATWFTSTTEHCLPCLSTRTLEVRGTPLPVLEEVAYSATDGSAQFDFTAGRRSRNTSVPERGSREANRSPCNGWMPPARRSRCWRNPAFMPIPRLSPDGQRLALDSGIDGHLDV